MDILSKEELRYLFEKRNRFCVSILLPTHRAGLVREIEESRIQLKDLLRDAESRLAGAGLARSGVVELLSPAQQLLRRRDFWRYQSDGLAIFLGHGFFRYFRLPLKLSAFVTVAERFEITPLLSLWTSEDPFYLLTLSLNQVRLFQGTRYAISEIGVRGLPLSLHETLGYSVSESQRQQHTLKAGLPEDELLYFRQIDEALRNSCKDQRVPLVLAGVEESVSRYRQVNAYAGLLDGSVAGNPDRLSGEELHARARKIVGSHYDEARNQAVLQYKERADPARTSKELQAILPAAFQGRIFYLFIAAGAEEWGKFDPEQNVVTVHESAEKGDEELLNVAVIQAILHGGTVHILDSSGMPDGALIAALFRY